MSVVSEELFLQAGDATVPSGLLRKGSGSSQWPFLLQSRALPLGLHAGRRGGDLPRPCADADPALRTPG